MGGRTTRVTSPYDAESSTPNIESRPSSMFSNSSIVTTASASSSISVMAPLPTSSYADLHTPSPVTQVFDFPSTEYRPSQLPTSNVSSPRHALMRSRRISTPANLVQTNYHSFVGAAAAFSRAEGNEEQYGKSTINAPSGNRLSVNSLSSFESLPEENETNRSSLLMLPPKLQRSSTSPVVSPTRTTFQDIRNKRSPSASPSRKSSATTHPKRYSVASAQNSYQSFSLTPPPSRPDSMHGSSPLGRDSIEGDIQLGPEVHVTTIRAEKEKRKSMREDGKLSERKKREDRRWWIALELRETEKSYVKVLEEIDTLYYQPLLSSAVIPVSDLALRRAKKSLSTPTSPILAPYSPRTSLYSPLEPRPLDSRPTSPTFNASPILSPLGSVLSRQEISEIFSNFPDVLGLSRVMMETLENTIPDRPSMAIPLADLSISLSPFLPSFNTSVSLTEPELSSSVDTVESEGPVTPVRPSSRGSRAADSHKESDESSETERNTPPPIALGKALLRILPFLKSYSLFVSNFSGALAKLAALEGTTGLSAGCGASDETRNRWKRFCHGINREGGGSSLRAKGLGLGGLLLNVVQRVPRYKFLLGDMVKYTEKDHPDYKDLRKAFAMVDEVATHLESQIQSHTNALQIYNLQKSMTNLDSPIVTPGRRLLKSGLLQKLDRKGNEQLRTFFLFNDILIHASGGQYATPSGGWNISERPRSTTDSALGRTTSKSHAGSGAGSTSFNILSSSTQYRYHARFLVEDITVVSMDDSAKGGGGKKFGFEILTPEKSFALYAETLQEKLQWIETLRETKSELLRDRRTLQPNRPVTPPKYVRDRRISTPLASFGGMSFLGLPSLSTPYISAPFAPRLGFIPPSPSEEVGPALSASPQMLAVVDDKVPTLLSLDSAIRLNLSAGPSPESPRTASTAAQALAELNSVEYRVMDNYCAPVWVSDSRVDRCMSCSGDFGMWRRRHHCRLCGGVVCWACSTKTFIIPSPAGTSGNDRLARSCDTCYETVFEEDSGSTTTRTLKSDLSPITTPAINDLLNSISAPAYYFTTPPLGTPAIGKDTEVGAVGRLHLLLGR